MAKKMQNIWKNSFEIKSWYYFDNDTEDNIQTLIDKFQNRQDVPGVSRDGRFYTLNGTKYAGTKIATYLKQIRDLGTNLSRFTKEWIKQHGKSKEELKSLVENAYGSDSQADSSYKFEYEGNKRKVLNILNKMDDNLFILDSDLKVLIEQYLADNSYNIASIKDGYEGSKKVLAWAKEETKDATIKKKWQDVPDISPRLFQKCLNKEIKCYYQPQHDKQDKAQQELKVLNTKKDRAKKQLERTKKRILTAEQELDDAEAKLYKTQFNQIQKLINEKKYFDALGIDNIRRLSQKEFNKFWKKFVTKWHPDKSFKLISQEEQTKVIQFIVELKQMFSDYYVLKYKPFSSTLIDTIRFGTTSDKKQWEKKIQPYERKYNKAKRYKASQDQRLKLSQEEYDKALQNFNSKKTTLQTMVIKTAKAFGRIQTEKCKQDDKCKYTNIAPNPYIEQHNQKDKTFTDPTNIYQIFSEENITDFDLNGLKSDKITTCGTGAIPKISHHIWLRTPSKEALDAKLASLKDDVIKTPSWNHYLWVNKRTKYFIGDSLAGTGIEVKYLGDLEEEMALDHNWNLFLTAKAWFRQGLLDLAFNTFKYLILQTYGGIYLESSGQVLEPQILKDITCHDSVFLINDDNTLSGKFIAVSKSNTIINGIIELLYRNVFQVEKVPDYIKTPPTNTARTDFTTGDTALTIAVAQQHCDKNCLYLTQESITCDESSCSNMQFVKWNDASGVIHGGKVEYFDMF
ncbi:MAG: hypothetical protein HRU36_03460 [Rickettsiales bacterium]|nr:hypothetical protein [Rickettsiales bacterium]